MCPEPSHAGAAESEGTESEPTPLLRPAGGIPDLCVTVGEIAAAAELLDRGRGPFAVDAERASGFRYSGRAYLIQIRRAEAGTVLIDPVSHGGDPLTVLAPVAEVLSTNEWILHSADQDLPCLAEVGMRPPALYDTELAGRLAGFDRVNLAAMVERLLGLGLTKGHGAADWSKRPLPSAWLNYAALDVELLIELRAAISRVLAEQGKTDWAAQEFEHLRSFESRPPPAAARQDRWRRTSGIHLVSPDLVRRLCWEWEDISQSSPDPIAAVEAYLRTGQARAWQLELVVPILTAALTGAPDAGAQGDDGS